MKKKQNLTIYSFLFVGIFVVISSSCKKDDHNNNSFTDPRDGIVYKTVTIGNYLWMAENLNTEKFVNGDPILEVKTSEEWINAGIQGKPAWCYYNNDPINEKKYGKLYNWHAVNDPRGLAPQGWHIPINENWTQLSNYLGGEEVAGTKMKSSSGWAENGNGNNSSGFNGLPGGYRDLSAGSFNFIGTYTSWWSSSPKDPYDHWLRASVLKSESSNFIIIKDGPEDGRYVRCVKD
jgi:uncharacterized protein (TIGR02145 family)